MASVFSLLTCIIAFIGLSFMIRVFDVAWKGLNYIAGNFFVENHLDNSDTVVYNILMFKQDKSLFLCFINLTVKF
jgi:hypothetical protein